MKGNPKTRRVKTNGNLDRRVTRRRIAQVVEKIAREFNPEKIILFGSYAYGRPYRDSDVDLLIVMRTKLRRLRQEIEISKFLFPRPFPMDILVETPRDLRHRLAIGDSFLREVVNKGQVLYERRSR